MSDTSYGIEIVPASKNGWFTPQESRNYYGRYSRDGYCVHWWGGGEDASHHDSIVNYINDQAAAGNKSVNYVLSDNKITLCVNPDSVAWCQQSGNATEISVETEPQLGDEGYKKHGWLKDQLDQRYATSCPGTISLDRIAQETDKWRRGIYDQPPVPTPAPIPTPPPVPVESVPVVVPITSVKKYTLDNAKLVNIKDMGVVKSFPIDTVIDIGGVCVYNGKRFLVSVYATQKGTLQGFLEGDLKDAPGNPTPTGTPEPTPAPPTAPEWVTNLRDIDDTHYWVKEATNLIDITTGRPTGAKTFAKDEEFIGSALTIANGIEYRITEYSFKKGVFNGVPISKLTLTPPGVPNIPPVPSTEQRLSALEKIVAAIVAALAKIGIKI
jgi:hypothetical protein